MDPVVEILAERMLCDPDTDIRPMIMVATSLVTAMAVIRLWAAGQDDELMSSLFARFSTYSDLTMLAHGGTRRLTRNELTVAPAQPHNASDLAVMPTWLLCYALPGGSPQGGPSMTDIDLRTGTELRAHRRRRARDEVRSTALRLFAARGFDEVTVEDIAALTHISQRTFFRYFASKEDLLFDRENLLMVLGDFLRERPAEEAPEVALKHAFIQASELFEADRRGAAAVIEIVRDDPKLLRAPPVYCSSPWTPW